MIKLEQEHRPLTTEFNKLQSLIIDPKNRAISTNGTNITFGEGAKRVWAGLMKLAERPGEYVRGGDLLRAENNQPGKEASQVSSVKSLHRIIGENIIDKSGAPKLSRYRLTKKVEYREFTPEELTSFQTYSASKKRKSFRCIGIA